jgi:hypothetical protein
MDSTGISPAGEFTLLVSLSLGSAADLMSLPAHNRLSLSTARWSWWFLYFTAVYSSPSDVEWSMAKLALVYGMRLLPADELETVGDAEITLKNGNKAHVTMHLIEGGEKEIRKQLMQSLDAFFEFYPEL